MNLTWPQFHEQRLTQRRIAAIPAVIVFDAARQRLSCIIRNISSEGAKLEVFGLSQIPVTFDLLIEGQLVPCRLVWRSLREIGVAFDARFRQDLAASDTVATQ